MTDPREPTPAQPVVQHGQMHGTGDTPPEEIRFVSSDALAGLASRGRSTSAPERIPRGAAGEQDRVDGLDAVRGLFLIMMTMTFALSGANLPTWMYHRQMPPPTYAVVDIAGITWLDVPYAGFMFAMAAAIPLMLVRRIDKGDTEVAIIGAALKRFALLIFFALLVAHSNTAVTGYENSTRALAIVGFLVMGMIYMRPRPDWDPSDFKLLTRVGWIAGMAFLALSPLVYDSTFMVTRIDQVIRDLAMASLVGSIVWYFTRDRLHFRLVIFGAVLALYLGAHYEGWVNDWWWGSPFAWLAKPADLVLLSVMIPGTIAGDLLIRWMRTPSASTAAASWSRVRVLSIALLCLVVSVLVIVALYSRLAFTSAQIVLGLLVGGIFLTREANSPRDRLLRQMFLYGSLWLLLGLVLEPAQSGIKKVPETLSYYLTITGLSTLLLAAMTSLTAGVKTPGWMRPLLDVGTNPLLGYVVFTIFLNSALEMVPALRPVMRSSVELSLLRSALSTVLVVLIIQLFTRARVYWRA